MNQSRQESPKAGHSMFVFMLTAIFALGAFVALNVLSLGVFTWVVVITALIALSGAFHYVVWGADLTEQVADEREAYLRQQTREREREEGFR